MKSILTKKPISSTGAMDINSIASQLYMLPIKLQFCHHLTTSHPKHEALNIYDDIQGMRDEILEKLMGYMGGERYSQLTLKSILGYNEDMPDMVADEVVTFGKQLQDWASSMGYGDIENLAQSLAGAGAKLKYLLTLS